MKGQGTTDRGRTWVCAQREGGDDAEEIKGASKSPVVSGYREYPGVQSESGQDAEAR